MNEKIQSIYSNIYAYEKTTVRRFNDQFYLKTCFNRPIGGAAWLSRSVVVLSSHLETKRTKNRTTL